MTKPWTRPVIKLTEAAVAQWRTLRRAGTVTGAAQPQLTRLIPPPGTPAHRVHVDADRKGGVIIDPRGRFVARFAKSHQPDGTKTWTVIAIESLGSR